MVLGHPVLREVALAVDPEYITNPEMQELADQLLWGMKHYNGVGLAAPQIGVRLRVAAVDVNLGQGQAKIVVFNPMLEYTSQAKSTLMEGCLSMPGLFGKIRRYDEVRVKALDRLGNELEWNLRGFPAQVLQHETDHLDGIVYIDKILETRSLEYSGRASQGFTAPK